MPQETYEQECVEVGIDYIADMINKALKPEHTTTVLLETMAGKGTEVGRNFEEIRAIIDKVELKENMGVCLDTCHVFDAGYDIVNDLDGVLEEFDRIIGLDRLKAIHLNDSLNVCGSHKDRHAKIGEGNIGLEAITRIINHPKLKHLPFLLETPNDLDKRFNEHKTKSKNGAKYTKSHNAIKLEAAWKSKDKSLACKLEYQIKNLTKKQKEKLINGEKLSTYLHGKIDCRRYRKCPFVDASQKNMEDIQVKTKHIILFMVTRIIKMKMNIN